MGGMMVLRKRIRTIRDARGLSREELARRVGLTLGQMGNIEKGKSALPRIPTLKRILEELAVHLGYSQATVAGYESGRRRIGIEDLERIADHYDVPLSHFLGRETEEHRGAAELKQLVAEAQRLRQAVRQLESDRMRDIISVPLIGTVPGGYPDFRDEEEAEQFYPIRRANIHPEGAYCLQITGNSMIGRGIFDGDTVFVDKTLNPEDGDIVIACRDDEAIIRVYREGDNGPYLEAASKGYKKLRLEEADIIGVVVESRRAKPDCVKGSFS